MSKHVRHNSSSLALIFLHRHSMSSSSWSSVSVFLLLDHSVSALASLIVLPQAIMQLCRFLECVCGWAQAVWLCLFARSQPSAESVSGSLLIISSVPLSSVHLICLLLFFFSSSFSHFRHAPYGDLLRIQIILINSNTFFFSQKWSFLFFQSPTRSPRMQSTWWLWQNWRWLHRPKRAKWLQAELSWRRKSRKRRVSWLRKIICIRTTIISLTG